MKLQRVVLLAVLCLAPAWAEAQSLPAPRNREARRLFESALQGYQKHPDADAATAAFSQAAALDPGFAAPRYNLALLAMRQERWADAQRWFKEYLALDDSSPRAYAVQAELSRLELILAAQKSPLGYRMLRYEALLREARLQADRGAVEDVLRLARKAEQVDSTRWEVPALAGAVLAEAKRFAEACPLLSTARERARSEQAEALETAEKACTQELRYHQLLEGGRRAYTQRDLKQAGEQLLEAWQLYPERTEGIFEGALALAEEGRWPQAREMLQGLSSSASPQDAAEARRLSAQFEHMQQLAEAAESPTGNVPPGPQFEQDLDQALAVMNQELTAARAEAAAYTRDAEQREQRLRDRIEELERELEQAEYTAGKMAEYASDFDRQAAEYSSGAYGAGGPIGAGLAKMSANEYRNKAQAAREQAQQLRKQLQEARAQLTE